jgi:hypothetical protein
MKPTFIFLVIVIFLGSCNPVQSKLDNAESGIEYAEENKKKMTTEDWSNLERKMIELESDLEMNRDKYTNEQVKELGKLQGRYVALLVKRGLNDFQNSLEDLENQMEGFMEGIMDSSEK